MEPKIYHPVDHGWAWFVCLGTGVQAFFVVGGLKSMGVLFMTLVEMFEAPPSLAALTLGLVAGGFALFAILSNAFAVVVGFRRVALGGAVICIMSGFLSIWAVNIYYIIVSLGLLSGLAFGAMATPSVVLLNLYFDKRKSFANGLAMVGSSLGQLCLPYVMTVFIDEFGYKGAMLLYTGICMQSIPAAMLLRPLEFWIPKSKKKKGEEEEEERRLNGKPGANGRRGSVKNGREVVDGPEDVGQSQTSLYEKGKDEKGKDEKGKDAGERLISGHHHHRSRTSLHRSRASLYDSQRSLARTSTMATSTGSALLGLSVDDVAAAVDADDVDGGGDDRARRFCQVLFDRDLLTSVAFWMLFFALGVGHAGFIDACLYLPSLGYELFDSKRKGALLIAVMGLCDVGGRLGGGYLADLGLVRRSHMTGLAMSLTGLSTILSMLHPVFPLLVAYSVVMGLIGGIYRILMPVLVRDLFGVEKLSAGVGLLFLAQGVMILPLPTILGYVKQVYHSYIPPMIICGVLLTSGGILMLFMPLYQRCDGRRSKRFNVEQDQRSDHDPENISFTMMANSTETNVTSGEPHSGNETRMENASMTEKDIENVKI